ncbi:exosporium leader peptide-containing protein [Bacillus cereus]
MNGKNEVLSGAAFDPNLLGPTLTPTPLFTLPTGPTGITGVTGPTGETWVTGLPGPMVETGATTSSNVGNTVANVTTIINLKLETKSIFVFRSIRYDACEHPKLF